MIKSLSILHHKFIKHDNEEGFTLIEVILSILILAIVSGVVIRLFMTSKDLGDQVKLEDMATFEAANVIEVAKSMDDPWDIENHQLFEMADVSDENLLVYYDASFEVVDEKQASFVMEVTIVEDGIPLIVDEFFEEDGRQIVSALYDIEVAITDMETNELMTKQVSSHYYTFVR